MEFSYFKSSQSESFSFYRIPRELVKGEHFKQLSTDAKLLYGLLLDRMGLSAKNEWFDELGRVYIYYTIEEIMEDLSCGHGKAGKLLAELDSTKGIGLIERVKQGQGKPTKIYVKQFAAMVPILPPDSAVFRTPRNGLQDSRKSEVRKAENNLSRPTENRSADISKSAGNYNNINYTEFSNTDQSIYPEDVIDDVKEQIDAEMLHLYYPNDDPDCIIELISEVLCSTAPGIKIGSETMPTAKVQNRFRRLSFEHVAYVLDALKDNTTKIHNIKAYLLTALYNAPLTIGPYYSAAVRHDNMKYVSP